MIDRRMVCIGATVGTFAPPVEVAAATPIGRLGEYIDPRWTIAQLVPLGRPPRPEELADPKAFGQYLTDNTYSRMGQAGISVDDARPEIDRAIAQCVAAAFRPSKGEIRKGDSLDAIPIE